MVKKAVRRDSRSGEMSDERIAALEKILIALEEKCEHKISAIDAKVEIRSVNRDQQLGALATEGAMLKAGLDAISGRVEFVEVATKPPSFLSIWGPAAASLGLVATIGGSFLTMIQREQLGQVAIVEAHIQANAAELKQMREDLRFLDSQIRIDERDFRGKIAGLEKGQELSLEDLKYLRQKQ